jgi:hypothetical protein
VCGCSFIYVVVWLGVAPSSRTARSPERVWMVNAAFCLLRLVVAWLRPGAIDQTRAGTPSVT